MDSERVFLETQINDIIQQLRNLTDEPIAILYEDDLLSYKYINELAFRVQEYLIRKFRTLKKKLHHKTSSKLKRLVKRPQKIRPYSDQSIFSSKKN